MSDAELKFECRRLGRDGRVVLTAWLGGETLAVEELCLAKSRHRTAFLDSVCGRYPGLDREALEAQLLRIAASIASQNETPPEQPEGAGKRAILQWPEEWPEPVQLADVLDEVVEVIRRHVILKLEAAAAIALWCAWTYIYGCGQVAPVLMVLSPTKRCGKTTLLRVLQYLVCRPLPASNCTPSTIYRVVEKYGPLTLMLDEADSFTHGNQELQGIVNSGHVKDFGFVLRNVPRPDGTYDTQPFATWCPKVVAAIGHLHDTWADRSIIVRMERKGRQERIERLDAAAVARLKTIARKMFSATARDEVKAALASGNPAMPQSLHNRAADNWTPLLCIADAAGGHWPTLARRVAVMLSGGESEEEDLSVRLLLDSALVFDSDAELPAKDLAERLAQLAESPWPTYSHGRPISAERVGRMLRRFGITPRKTKTGNVYRRDDVQAAATRYSPTPTDPTSTTSTLDANPCGTSTYGVEVSESPSSTFHPTSTHLNPDGTSTYDDGGSSGSKKPPIPENIEQWVF